VLTPFGSDAPLIPLVGASGSIAERRFYHDASDQIPWAFGIFGPAYF
jgi:hypothetical protein